MGGHQQLLDDLDSGFTKELDPIQALFRLASVSYSFANGESR